MRLPAGPFLPLSLNGGLLAASPPSTQLQSSFFSSYPGGDVTPQGPGPQKRPSQLILAGQAFALSSDLERKTFHSAEP